VTLRVYPGKARVGAVEIGPRSRRKKTVSAQLVLRLDRKLAGRQLRLEVEAVDVHGARQLERGAGSIRVTR
jgi:hypothetical protein